MTTKPRSRSHSMTTIRFYSKTPEFSWLSNFHVAPFVLDGVTYPSVEHYYQSQKTSDPEKRARILEKPTPKEAKAAAKRVTRRSDWEAVKGEVMERAVRAKFGQNPDLAEMLLATGDAVLVHIRPWEARSGKPQRNRDQADSLGALIMQVREELRDERGQA